MLLKLATTLSMHSLRHPRLVCLVILLLSCVAVVGLNKIDTNRSLNKMFRSASPDYVHYQRVRDTFPLSEQDVVVLLSAEAPFTPDKVESLRDLLLELQLLSEISSVVSMFSIPVKPSAEEEFPQLIPDTLPDGAEFQRLMRDVSEHSLAKNKLLMPPSAVGQSAIFVAVLTKDAASQKMLPASLKALDEAAAEMLEGTGISFQMFGAPVFQEEIRKTVQSDRLTINVLAFFVVLLVTCVLLRPLRLVLVIALCPLLSVLLTFGAMGFLGIELSSIMNAIPALLIVISMADGLHLVHEFRAQCENRSTDEALLNTVTHVSPSCGLAGLTTAIAILSLLVAESAVIKDFAVLGALGVCITLLVTLTLVPAGLSMMASHVGVSLSKTDRLNGLYFALVRFANAIADLVPARRVPLAALGFLMFFLTGFLHLSLEPHFRLRDEAPNQLQSRIAQAERHAKLVSANPLYLVVRYPQGSSLFDPKVVRVIGNTQKIADSAGTLGNAWSIELLRQGLQLDWGDGAFEKTYRAASDSVRARFVNETTREILFTLHFPDLGAEAIKSAGARLEQQLKLLRNKFPEFGFELTGLGLVSAKQATEMLKQLNIGLLVAIVLVILLIGLSLRSTQMAVLSCLPNVLPLTAVGASLYIFGYGLDYSSVVGLTVAFGLAVDDTVHMIMRVFRERQHGKPVAEAIDIALRRVGPVVVFTTVILIGGVSVTMFGDMPQTQRFGFVCAFALLFAMIADLFVLPALALLFLKDQGKHLTSRTNLK